MTVEKRIELIAERCRHEPQSRQYIEEVAELTQVINRLWGKRNFGGNDGQIAEAEGAILDRMVDTLTTLWQTKYLLGSEEGPLVRQIDEELNRQLEQVGATEER